MKIGYARVSTDDQELGLQTDALQDAGCDKIYTEKVSTRRKSQPELEKALDNLRAGDTFVVWRLDRLGRDLSHLISTVEALKEKGVEFVSIIEHIDTSTPTGELVFHVFASIAQFERSLNSERTKAGVAAARKRGITLGRRPVMTEKNAKRAYQMLQAKTVTKTEVAKYFGVSRPTLDKALRSVSIDEEQGDLF
ncbi:TPA: recombinase family protein [Vibrio parahaemolyticus]|nr:recombinase family protein [Vibrio parahaemolyticus]